MKMHRNPAYSCKVFLGGVPWDITEGKNMSTYAVFLAAVLRDVVCFACITFLSVIKTGVDTVVCSCKHKAGAMQTIEQKKI